MEAQEELDVKVDDDAAPATSEAALAQDEADERAAEVARVNGKPKRGRKHHQPQSGLN